MRRALVPAAVALLLVAAGCGGNSQRAAIASYIKSVDDVERGMSVPLQDVTSANRRFGKTPTDPKVEKNLAASVRTMRRLRAKLAGVKVPPEAANLQGLLLQLVDRETALAEELDRIAIFVPRYQSALQPLPAASTALKKTLGTTAKGATAAKRLDAEKASALLAYADTAGAVAESLRGLDPPAAWRPTYEQQLASLIQLASSATALAHAIQTKAAPAIPRLLEQFDAAAVSTQTTAAQKRDIAAVKQYNQRIRDVYALARKVQRERAALQKKYG